MISFNTCLAFISWESTFDQHDSADCFCGSILGSIIAACWLCVPTGCHTVLCSGLQGIESTAETAVAAVSKGSKQLALCKSCSRLLNAVTENYDDPRPLSNVVTQLQLASDGDVVIHAALDTIPNEALQRGIQSRSTLQKRFAKVKTACSRVALVGDKEEGGILTYFVSHVSSLLHWSQQSSSSVDVVDVSSLDVPMVLDLAEKRVNEGKLDEAVRLVNQLSGQPRVIAQDWLDEARLFLATQQAADVVSSCALLHLNVKTEADPTPAKYDLVEE